MRFELRRVRFLVHLRHGCCSAEGWVTHEWIKQAILLYFRLRKMETIEAGPLEFHDKIPLKRNFKEARVRVVPHAICRYGAHLEPGVGYRRSAG